MKPHIIVEIVLLIFCTVTVIAAYACCVVAGRCSRMEEKEEEKEEIKLPLYPRKVNKPFRSVWVDEEYKEIGDAISADKIQFITCQFDSTAKTTPPIVGKGGEKDGRNDDIL